MSAAEPAGNVRPLGELLDPRQKWLLLVTLMLSLFVAALNQSLVATATPRILADLGGFSLLSWVFTVYMLASTVLSPLVGRLSDMFGRRTFLIGGLVVFAIGSVACGVSLSMPQLIAARAVQGVGGGMILACVFAVIGDLFPPAQRAKYIGFFTGTFTLAALTGPLIGGLLTDHAHWRWCFFVNVPVAVAAVVFISANLPATRRGGRLRDIDFLGAILLSGTTISLLLGLAWAQDAFGWGSVQALGLFAAAAVLAVLFILHERGHPEAVLPLHLFREREFVLANLATLCLGVAGFAAIQYLPTFVQTALGASATASGLVTTPHSLGLLCTSIVGGQLLSRTGRYRVQVLIGCAFILTATLLLTTVSAGMSQWRIAPIMVLNGLGFGLAMPTMSVVIQNAVSHAYMGVATGARQFFMQIGQVLGTAVFGVVLATSYGPAFQDHLPPDALSALPPATLRAFDDPTLALDERRFADVRAEVLALPGGEALLAGTLAAQQEGVTAGVRHIFLGAASAVLVVAALVFAMKGLPLRRAFGPTSGPGGAPEANVTPVAPPPAQPGSGRSAAPESGRSC